MTNARSKSLFTGLLLSVSLIHGFAAEIVNDTTAVEVKKSSVNNKNEEANKLN